MLSCPIFTFFHQTQKFPAVGVTHNNKGGRREKKRQRIWPSTTGNTKNDSCPLWGCPAETWRRRVHGSESSSFSTVYCTILISCKDNCVSTRMFFFEFTSPLTKKRMRFFCEWRGCTCRHYTGGYLTSICHHCGHGDVWHSREPPCDAALAFVSPRPNARKPTYSTRKYVGLPARYCPSVDDLPA